MKIKKMNKINLLEKKVGNESNLEDTGKNYGLTGLRYLFAVTTLLYSIGCAGVHVRDDVNLAELGWDTIAVTGNLGGKKLNENQRQAAATIARRMGENNTRDNSQEEVNQYPKITNIGDYDNDGEEEWVYDDMKGNRFWAKKGYFDKTKENFHTKKEKGCYIPGFVYYDYRNPKEVFEIPKDTQIGY